MKRDDADGHKDYPPGAAGNPQYHRRTDSGDCIPLLITHFVRPQALTAARERGIIVVQSF